MVNYLAAFKAPRNGECMGSVVEAATGSESFSNLVCKGFKPMLVCSKPVGGIRGQEACVVTTHVAVLILRRSQPGRIQRMSLIGRNTSKSPGRRKKMERARRKNRCSAAIIGLEDGKNQTLPSPRGSSTHTAASSPPKAMCASNCCLLCQKQVVPC